LLRRVDDVGEQYGGENTLNILHDDLAAAGDEFLDVAAERFDVALCPRPVIAGGILDVARARNASREVAAVGDGDSYICFIVQDQDWQPELRQDRANVINALLLSGDPEQEYFADGIVEDIITALSRFRQLFVIARNSSFTYKGRAVDVKQVGRELGVRYVLEGSVRKAVNRVRITGQLIDVSNGAHLWADRFDGGIEDIFDLQDRVTASVVGAIAPKLEQAEIERARGKRSDNLDAYDLYLRALPYVHAKLLGEIKLALPLLEQALAIDPDYAIAHAYAVTVARSFGIDGPVLNKPLMRGGFEVDDRGVALRHARAALASGRDDSSALAIGGFVLAMLDRDFATAVSVLDQSLALNGNSALAYGFSALVRALHDQYDTAIEHAERALRLSPFDPQRNVPQGALAIAHFFSGNFERSAAATADAHIGWGARYAIQVASTVRLGKLNEARVAAARLIEAAPDFTVAGFERMARFMISRPELVATISSALTEAGLP
jgi:TolB-like protein